MKTNRADSLILYILIVVLILSVVSGIGLAEYLYNGQLFSFYEDGSYCVWENTPWRQCDCRTGWPCDDSTDNVAPPPPNPDWRENNA